jgi:hypothetical protein
MRIGLMWYNGNLKQSFAEKCAGAIAFYTAKYNHAPTEIWVHPATAIPEGINQEIPNVAIRTSRSILPNHFWVGLESNILQSEE